MLINTTNGNMYAVNREAYKPFVFKEPVPIEYKPDITPTPLRFMTRASFGVWGDMTGPYLSPRIYRKRIGKPAWRKPVMCWRYRPNPIFSSVV